jgi:hypothetical protein
MEEHKTGMEEAANLGGAAVAMAFDIASGNYVRARIMVSREASISALAFLILSPAIG